MAKEKNPAIGEMPCPFAGCQCKASVHRYRERSADEKMRRFAGRVYAVCERKHRCEDQDYILENATIWGARKSDDKPAEPAAVPPVKTPEKPAPAAVPKAPEKTPAAPVRTPDQIAKGWGWFS